MRALIFPAAILAAAVASAETTPPKGVFTMEQLEEAQALARDEGRGLAFVLTSLTSTWGNIRPASSAAFKALKKYSAVVFVQPLRVQQRRTEFLSPVVRSIFDDPAFGPQIPRVLVTSPDMTREWGRLSNSQIVDRGTLKGFGAQIDAIRKGEAEPPGEGNPEVFWRLKQENRGYRGTFVSIESQDQIVLDRQGKELRVPLAGFDEGTVRYAHALAGVSANPEPNPKPTLELENWTGSNGKVIVAKFLSLSASGVKLEAENGKQYTVPLTRLSEASQARARELGGGEN